jgi:hypothetical protein
MIRTSSLLLILALATTGFAGEPSREQRFRAAWEAGQDAFNLGKYPEARRHFLRARDLAPSRPGPHRWLGRVARVLEDWEACVESGTTAVRLKPDSPQTAEVRKDVDACREALGRPAYGRPLAGSQGALAVLADVEGAVVTVDGIAKGPTPVEPMPLNKGLHHVRLVAEGLPPAEVEIEVIPGIVVDAIVLVRARPPAPR